MCLMPHKVLALLCATHHGRALKIVYAQVQIQFVPSIWINEVWLCLHTGQNALDLRVYSKSAPECAMRLF